MDVVEETLADLAKSGISSDAAEHAGIFAVDDATEVDAGLRPVPAMVLPYIGVDGEPMKSQTGADFIRVRYLASTRKKGLGGGKDMRYGQPPGSGVRAYFPQVAGMDWRKYQSDTSAPIIITEGEKKALAASLAGWPTIGLGGVFNWMERDALLPELSSWAWEGRIVYICFDSDAINNGMVLAAEARLAHELGIVHKADVRIVRIPALEHEPEVKIGLDDFIVQNGKDALHDLLETATTLKGIARKISALNEHVTWVERDGLIFDSRSHVWISKTNFTKGSIYSTMKLAVQHPKKKDDCKAVSLANAWLTSPYAARVDDVAFLPNAPRIATKDDIVSLNLWSGYRASPGNVKPWLALTKHLFSQLPADLQDFPAKLMAYKAQNPTIKVPLALVLVGPQGCGKSMWAKTIREAFAPYGAAISSSSLLGQFNGWIESSLICVIDEAQAIHLSKGSDQLKSLISEQRQPMNEKYRPTRQIDTYTSYILTSNDRRVGAYSQDDRRMFVIDTPQPAAASLYAACGQWLDTGGAERLMHWLLEYDLEGWTPPATAPMTAEKYMAYMESLTPVMRLAEEMRTASHNTVRLWLDAAMEWARLAETSAATATQASDVRHCIARIKVRPFYTPEELMLIFPAMVGQLHGVERTGWIQTPGELSRQLRSCGIPYLKCSDDPRGFKLHGRIQQFLVIADADKWSAPVSQAEFDEALKAFPEYGAA